MKKFFLLNIILVTYLITNGQITNNTCQTADPFCTGITYNFPAGVNTGQAQSGPNYGCLLTTPNPVWYYLLIDQPGDIEIYIYSQPQRDLDFICWGPFNDITTPCQQPGTYLTNNGNTTSHHAPGPGGGYPSGYTVDCSYNPSWHEWCYISTAQTGQYYILLITNYSNQPCNIIFSQTNAGQPGAGSTNCNIVVCNMDNITYTVGQCNPQTNQYCVNGNILFHFNPPNIPITTGTLTIVDHPSGISQTFNPPFNSPVAFNLCGINSDGAQHTLTATFSDAPTCTYTVTYTAPPPCNACFANAGSNQSVCGLTTTLNAIESPGDINTHWNPMPGITYSDINEPNSQVTASAPGIYNLVWTITNSNGLTCHDTVTVEFKARPTANFTLTPAICQGQSATATYTGTGGSQFNWQFPNGNPGNSFSQGPHNITYNVPGTYTVSLVTTASNGCVSDTFTQQVIVHPLPSSSFTASSPICQYQTSTVQYTGGSGPYSYSWNWGTGTAVPGTGPGPHQVSWNSTGVQTITLQVTNTQTGCVSNVTTQYVNVLDNSTPNCCTTPSPNAGPDANVCGLTYTMNANPPAPGNVAGWLLQSGPQGGTVIYSNQYSHTSNVIVNMPGTYIFEWREVSGACDSSDFVTITFTVQPVANAGNKGQVCGTVYTLGATPSVPGSTGSWSVVPPMSASFNPPSSPNATVTANSGYGTYYFVWTEQNGNCISRDTVQVDFLAIPVVNAGSDTIGCGQYAQLHAEDTYPGYWTASTNVIYTPHSADPNALVWVPNIPQGQPSYQVTFVWNAFNGICPGKDTVVITFIRLPHAEAGPNQSVCGYTTQLQADTIGSGIVSAYWTSSVPGIIINQSGNIPFNATVDASNVANFYINSQRPVYFYWNTVNGPGCSKVDSVLVTFYEIPEANAGLDTAVCGKSYTFNGAWSIDNPTGLWHSPFPPINPGTANFTPNNTPNSLVTVTQFGVYQFIWREMNAGNTSCYDIDTITIEFKVTPMPDAGLDQSVCGKFAYICATPSVPGGQWSGPTGVAFYDAPNGNIVPSNKDSACTWIRWPSENDTITMYWTEFNGVCYGYDSVNVYFGSIQEAIITTLPSDSLWCGPSYPNLSAVQPAYGYGYWIDAVQNTTFTPSPYENSNLVATIDTGGTTYYGPHYFYWITVNGNCRDTSDVHYVRFIQKPRANAGGNYWAGLFGPNSDIKTDTVCGLNYQMGAIPSIGVGTWYSLDPTNVYFVNGVGNHTTTHVYNDSLYLTCNGCYTVFSSGQKYREFIWQEYNDICFDSDTLRLYFAPRPTGQFTVTMPACRYDSSMIIAHTWNLPNHENYGIVHFAWTYPGGTLSPVISDPTISDTIYVSWSSGNSHTVTLITTNMWGCHSGIVTRIVNEPPKFSPTDSVYAATCGDCNGKIRLFTSYNNNPNYFTFEWLDTGSPTLVRDNLCPKQTYYVKVKGQSLSPDASPGTICVDTIGIWLPDTGHVYVNFDTLSIQQMQAAPYSVYLINYTINGRKYSWRIYDDKGNLVATSTQTNLEYTFTNPGCYRIVLIGTSKQGCRDTMEYAYVCVDAVPVLEIPNVFTPNGDGQNDEWLIHAKSIKEFKCTIYNRWGKKIYEWDDVTKGWNGKINGNGADASPGVYYYVITAKDKKDKEYEEKGYFYLLKEKK